ncbi:glycerophosphodiester phosphodiesterase [Phytohabitans sp. ZYX-F-186]|uniref:Glycerophosphodiester phosphodiesterase n=1 Tax=Phytohabitans maris TaxID=3071409 RepID=A0ABU0ZB26_9ACTN|nr:glycerophosphodiester phosphodiesterase [Phytohabitans sp. ZYX-F-186]MDQ7904178.1 glycerophosphodiester phosphodiesterase [Phytohabitans sp. ZYX-F-186]
MPPLMAIAHRAGNDTQGLRAALDAGVDLVEADIHLFKGAIEVRHLKTLGPGWLWDTWVLVRRRDVVLPELHEVLAVADGDHRLMLDLKGPAAALAPRVAALLREVAPDAPITVCGKHWRMLDSFEDPVRRVYSSSNRFTLRRLRERVRRKPAYGVSIRRELLTPAVVAELRESVEVVMVWPVDTPPALAHARHLGVSAVISKNLDLLRDVMAG